MTSTPYWLDDPQRWQTGVLGPYVLPGLVSVEPDEIARQLERRKPSGKSGGPLEDKGYKPIKTKVTIVYWTRAHHEQWNAILPRINPRRENATKDPQEFRHPQIEEFDVGPWIVASIKPGMPTSKGGRKIEIMLEEWFPETKTAKKGTGKVQRATELRRDAENQVLVGMTQLIDAYRDSDPNAPPDPSDPAEIAAMVGDLTGTSRE